ncbi:uncharacterized protein TNCV_4926511 [Trichonephila clavipes]|nr:uncharacterized protein TNCV_4926511 [Trichonephila clavipes]
MSRDLAHFCNIFPPCGTRGQTFQVKWPTDHVSGPSDQNVRLRRLQNSSYLSVNILRTLSSAFTTLHSEKTRRATRERVHCTEAVHYTTQNGVVKETFIEEIHHPLDKTKSDCPDILRNENCLCLNTSKDSGEPCTPQSESPESPRYNSTPSGSTGSCLSVYHEKTSIRSLAGDADSANVVKLHPIMVLRIDEDSYKYTES